MPGMKIPVWFRADRHRARYDLVCAELCGWGHYKMKGRLTVEIARSSSIAWLAESLPHETGHAGRATCPPPKRGN